MFYNEIAIQILFSMLYLSSTVNDKKSNNSEHGVATNNSIVSDANERAEGQWKQKESIAHGFVENVCPLDFNISKQFFPSLKFNQANNWNATVEQRNLRLYAETSSDIIFLINGFKTQSQAFIKESVNYIFKLNESQKFLIVLSYLYAIWNFYGVRIWTIISKIRSKLFGKPTTVIPSKCKISLSERTDDLPTTPSEKSTIVQHDLESCDELKHSLSFDSWESSSEESCEDEFPDEFFLFPSDCGNVGWELGPDDWEKIEPDNSSQELLTSDVEGTFSTRSETGRGYDEVSDEDSWVSSSSHRHSLVPMEMAFGLSCTGSDGEPMSVTCWETSNGCDEVTSSELSYDELTSDLDSSFSYWEDECSAHGSTVQRSDSESDINNINDIKELNKLLEKDINRNRWVAIDEDEIFEGHSSVVDMTLEQRVKNHAVAAAFFTGTFLLPCFIAAKLLK